MSLSITQSGAYTPPAADGECILVLVDLQVGFAAASAPWLLDAVETEVRLANANGWSIVALELITANPPTFYGNTHDRLVAAARTGKLAASHRQRFFMRAKATWDGTSRVQDVCLQQNYQPKRFRVCGVKSRHCVQSTATGLAAVFPKSLVEVVTAACNQDLEHDWSNFPVVANLRLV